MAKCDLNHDCFHCTHKDCIETLDDIKVSHSSERKKQWQKAYREKNREKFREYDRKWRAKNPNYQKIYYQTHAAERIAYQCERYRQLKESRGEDAKNMR